MYIKYLFRNAKKHLISVEKTKKILYNLLDLLPQAIEVHGFLSSVIYF